MHTLHFMHLRPLTLIGIVLSMVSGIGLGILGYHAWLDARGESLEARAFDTVLDQVQSSYVDELERRDLMVNALKGMLHGLDEHSNYLDSRDFRNLQAETEGRFGGIGVELSIVDERFTVIAPLDGTPASRAGIQAGDRIIGLDGEPLAGSLLSNVVDRLRGEPGTEVTLTLIRDTVEEPFDLTLVRDRIEVASVRSHLLEPGYGYVRISQFQSETGREFVKALESLEEENGGDLAGLVLDLRNNPGGVLQASVSVADALLTDGLIVYTEGRLPSSHLRYRASGRDLMAGRPVVVLINEGSASAAEIVAGALKDQGRALLIGRRSYGKGSVQSVMPIADDQALKLTTAYYYTPSGRNIHHEGIEPDVTVRTEGDGAEDTLMNEALARLKTASGLHARL